MIGGSLFYDFARVGATPAPFQSFVLSAGVVTDYVYGAGMHWQGGYGGFPCDGSGSRAAINASTSRPKCSCLAPVATKILVSAPPTPEVTRCM
jgi:hypothetical protein